MKGIIEGVLVQSQLIVLKGRGNRELIPLLARQGHDMQKLIHDT